MKRFLLFIFISINCFSANWIPKEEVGNCSFKRVSLKQCEGCIKTPKKYNCKFHEIQEAYDTKKEVESCLDETDCQEKLESKPCEKGEAVKNLESLEVYCTWHEPAKVVENATKKANYENAKAQKEAAKEQRKSRKEAIKSILEKGNRDLTNKERDELFLLMLKGF